MKLIAPAFVVLSTNVLAILIITTTVIAPYAGYLASGSNQGSLTTTTTVTASTTSVSSSQAQTSTTSTTSQLAQTTTVRTTFTGTSPSTISLTTTSTTTTTTARTATQTSTSSANTSASSTTTNSTTTTTSTTLATSTTSNSTTTTTTTTAGCQARIALPAGTYQAGQTIEGTAYASCPGSVKAQIYNSSTASQVFHHTTPVSANTTTTVISTQLQPGTYTASANFDSGHGYQVSATSRFTVSGGASPSGMFYPASLSVVALAFLILKKQGKDAGPRKSQV